MGSFYKQPKNPPKMSSSVGSSDRISSLPDDVLHHILSFLKTHDVIRMSVLSRRWRYIWTSMPYLDIDQDAFRSSRGRDWSIHDLREWFADCVTFVLSLRDGSDIKRLRLLCEGNEQLVYRAIFVATRHNVEELELNMKPYGPYEYELPSCVAYCKSLRVLKLGLHGNPLRGPTLISCYKLKTLHLVAVQLWSEFGTKLLSSCPVLENLYLRGCIVDKLNPLEISGGNLKSLTFVNTGNGLHCYGLRGDYRCLFLGELKVSAPNLLSFYYVGPTTSSYSLQNLTSLKDAFIHFTCTDNRNYFSDYFPTIVSSLHNAETVSLSLHFVQISPLLIEGICFPTTLYNLKSLKLPVRSTKYCVQGLIHLLKYSPNLEAIYIDLEERYPLESPLEPPEQNVTCLIYHLKKVVITNFVGWMIAMELVKFLLNNGKVLEEMTVTYVDLKTKIESFEKVLAFTRASPNVVISFPTCGRRKPLWFEVEDRNLTDQEFDNEDSYDSDGASAEEDDYDIDQESDGEDAYDSDHDQEFDDEDEYETDQTFTEDDYDEGQNFYEELEENDCDNEGEEDDYDKDQDIEEEEEENELKKEEEEDDYGKDQPCDEEEEKDFSNQEEEDNRQEFYKEEEGEYGADQEFGEAYNTNQEFDEAKNADLELDHEDAHNIDIDNEDME